MMPQPDDLSPTSPLSAERECHFITVSSPEYFVGTLVLIYSFRKYNPWFQGSIRIIHDNLESRQQEILRLFPRTSAVRVENDLLDQVERLATRFPDLRSRIRRFYSLEAFRPSAAEEILFVDSDAFCVGNLAGVFSISGGLAASRDGCWYHDRVRDAATFLPVKPGQSSRVLPSTFNTGVMVLKPAAMASHRQLMECLEPAQWEEIQADNTDQVVLNRVFQGGVDFLPGSLNFRERIASEIQKKEGIPPETARIIHFTGSSKPWNTEAALARSLRSPVFLGFWTRWLAELRETAGWLDLRGRFGGAGSERPNV